MFLAAASAGAAKFLVTGDADLLVLDVYEQCSIITAETFLDHLPEPGDAPG